MQLEALDEIKNEYNLQEFLRMTNKEREPTTTVRIELKDEQSLNNVIQNGIYFQNYHYRV